MSNLLRNVRLRIRRAGAMIAEEQQKLDMLVQTLEFAEKAAETSGVPFLKGAIALALSVAQCAQGYKSNNEELNRLALSCGKLMTDIADQLAGEPDVPQSMALLVKDLLKTLEDVENTAKTIVNQKGQARRFLTQKDNKDKLNGLYRDVADAQLRFLTLTSFVSARDRAKTTQDTVYSLSSIVLGECYETGNEWVAFNAKLADSGENLIVKRYQSRDGMHEDDIKAFKNNWHGNLVQYIGRSFPGSEQPFNVLRGVTSDHVSHYIAVKFNQDNQRGSVEALRLLKDLANALAFTVGHTNSSAFDVNASAPHFELTTLTGLQISKLLAGDPAYEPNPAIEYYADPSSHTRLEYLRPILGHIHCGSGRFKETNIETAFKNQGLMLFQALRDLRTAVHNPLAPPDTQVLQAMWRRWRELHYVAHFREPLRLDVGDIGYVSGNPPQFTRLANVRKKLMDGVFPYVPPRVKPLRAAPFKRWMSKVVNGVTRHSFKFRASDMKDLAVWRKGRARLEKDFMLRRINVPNESESGLVVDCSKAWKVLADSAARLASAHAEPVISADNLILVVYFKQQSGHATFSLNKKVSAAQWYDIWAREGFTSPPEYIYFFESPPGGPNGVWGYFSFSPLPGTPHSRWTPERDDAGELWGWTFQSEDWTVEISKPNVKQYIRYVQL
ncbi:hypothetical protein B0H17DRAFT_1196382 [Mycena rosella]|uniref:Uncharacterized protein n=1 Tax=Mycena rosella TaxID=1033263 RepID=A0AAD7DUD0_MYCRO|nr:hypothetical protein B0H17DRAFT_1196382 [Mycena rosella]